MKNCFTAIKPLIAATTIVLFIAFGANAQNTVVKWDFNNETLDPAVGTGTATNIGETTYTFATGVNGSPDRAWNTATYPEQGTLSGTAGAEFMTSTVGFAKISLFYQHRASGTASRWAEIYYTTDAGANWTLLGDNAGGLAPNNTFYPFEFDLGEIAEADNNPGFGLRIVSVFSPVAFDDGLGNSFGADEAYHRSAIEGGSAYGPGGTWRFDEVTISAAETVGIGERSFENTRIACQNGNILISLPAGMKASASIYNIMGQSVSENIPVTANAQLSASGLKGYYLVRLFGEQGNQLTRKVFIP